MNDYGKMLTALQDELIALRQQKESQSQLVYSNAKLSEMFGVCPATLLKWRHQGLIGYSQIGSVVIYSQKDVLDFLKNNHQEAVV